MYIFGSAPQAFVFFQFCIGFPLMHLYTHTNTHAPKVTAYTLCFASAGEFHFRLYTTFSYVDFLARFCTAMRRISIVHVAFFFSSAYEFCFHGTFSLRNFHSIPNFPIAYFWGCGRSWGGKCWIVGRLLCWFGIWCTNSYWFLLWSGNNLRFTCVMCYYDDFMATIG